MRYVILLLGLLFISCSKNPETFIEHLNGYWEIQQVKLANGITHNYSFNGTVDYFNVSDSLTGFRKKLKPNLNGTYKTSHDFENIILKIEEGNLNIFYNTAFDSWKETVLFANSEQLKIKNQNKDVYLYKRFKPITMD